MHNKKAVTVRYLGVVRDVRNRGPQLAEDSFELEIDLTPKKTGRKKGWRKPKIVVDKPL